MDQHLCLSLNECLEVLSDISCEPKKISAVVAYVKESGVDELLSILSEKVLSRSMIITGLDFYLTEPNALRKLIELGADVLIYNGIHEFHPKLYLIECSNGREHLIVGSANISRGAITGDNIEVNIMTSYKEIVERAKKIIQEIRQQCVNAGYIITEYEKNRKELPLKPGKYRIPLSQAVSTKKPPDKLAYTTTHSRTTELNDSTIQEQEATLHYLEEISQEPLINKREDLPTSKEAPVEAKPKELAEREESSSHITEHGMLIFDSYKLFHANKYVSFIHIIRTATKAGINTINAILTKDPVKIEGKATIYKVVKGADSILVKIPKIQNIIARLGKSKKRRRKLRNKVARILLVQRYGFNIENVKSKLIDALLEKGYLIRSNNYVIANIPLLVKRGALIPRDDGWTTIILKEGSNTIKINILLKLRKAELNREYEIEVNTARRLYYLLSLMKNRSADDEELAKELLGEDSISNNAVQSAYKSNAQGQINLHQAFCDIINKYVITLKNLPRVARKASNCKYLKRKWKRLKKLLCTGSKIYRNWQSILETIGF